VHLGLIVREPVGVVGGVLPWNFPLMTLAWKIGPALATGNSLVIKPAELASLTTLRLAELATEAGIPNGVLNVVPGLGHVAGKALGLHAGVDMVTFTGSTEVGRAFLRYSADSNLKGIVLECGGKSPQIVMADCRDQIDVVAADLAEAAFLADRLATAGVRPVDRCGSHRRGTGRHRHPLRLRTGGRANERDHTTRGNPSETAPARPDVARCPRRSPSRADPRHRSPGQ
jgi:Aldehyde dehydrogenase family